MAKKPDIERMMEENKPLVFGVLEANIGSNSCLDILAVDGYILERDNLHLANSRNRAAVYINSQIKYSRRSDLEPADSPTIWIEINPQSANPYLVFIGYREWQSLVGKAKARKESGLMRQQLLRLATWGESWAKAEQEDKEMILLGDWNVDVRPWAHPTTPLTEYQKQRAPLLAMLKEMATSNGLELLLTEPTRKQGVAKPSTLDVVLTNRPKVIREVNLLPSSSDHLVIKVSRETKSRICPPELFTRRSFKGYTKEKMCNLLDAGLLDSLIDCVDTELVATVIIGHISEAINKIAPMKRVQPRANYAPYLSRETKEKMSRRDELRWVAKASGKDEDYEIFKKEKNATLKQQRKEKVQWAQGLIGEDMEDSKRVWNVVESICKYKKNNTIGKLVVNGIVTTKKNEIAKGLNEYFVQKVSSLLDKMPIPASELLDELKQQEPVNVPQMELNELSPHGLELLLKKVSRTPASGVDGISGIILLDIIEVIRPSLLHLINLSLATGIYPSIFKLTKIIPVLKQGKDPSYPGSYRPVSNISTIGKLLERAAMDQVTAHLDRNKLTNKDQHGGRAGHSTSTCLGEVLEDARVAVEAKLRVAVFAIDLTAAYDLCHHGLLIQKCRLLNLGPVVNFISSFLSKRSQMVEIQGVGSPAVPTGDQGVVQGGPSSGKFFNIYIDKLPAVVNQGKLATTPAQSTHKQYVDDGSTVARGATEEQLVRNITEDFGRIRNYLQKHRMVINADKTQLMEIKSKGETPLEIILEGATISSQASIKILGVTVNNQLGFDEHLWKGKGSLVRKIQVKTSKVGALRKYLPPKTLYQIGDALINSTIQYGAALWGQTTDKNLDKIQAAQVRAARIISGRWRGKGDNLHRQQIMEEVKWLNVKQLVSTATLNLAKKGTTGSSSVGVNSMFKVRRPPEANRSSGIRIQSKGKVDSKAHSFAAGAAQAFNKLPEELRDDKLTPKGFKNGLKKHIKKVLLLPHH